MLLTSFQSSLRNLLPRIGLALAARDAGLGQAALASAGSSPDCRGARARPAARPDRRSARCGRCRGSAGRLRVASGACRRMLAIARLHLGDPAAPQHDESLPAKKIVRAAVDDPRRGRIAAVVHFVEDGPVGLGCDRPARASENRRRTRPCRRRFSARASDRRSACWPRVPDRRRNARCRSTVRTARRRRAACRRHRARGW